MGKAIVDRYILTIPVEYIENPSSYFADQLNGGPLINPKV